MTCTIKCVQSKKITKEKISVEELYSIPLIKTETNSMGKKLSHCRTKSFYIVFLGAGKSFWKYNILLKKAKCGTLICVLKTSLILGHEGYPWNSVSLHSASSPKDLILSFVKYITCRNSKFYHIMYWANGYIAKKMHIVPFYFQQNIPSM